MDAKKWMAFLGWSALINYAMILFAWGAFMFAHDFMYRVWADFHSISNEEYDELFVMTIAIWKVLVFVLNLSPYLAMRIVFRKRTRAAD